MRDMVRLTQLIRQHLPQDNLHYHPVQCLVKMLTMTQEGLDATKKVDNEPRKAQASVIKTLELLNHHITSNYLPGTGPTGSPLTSPRAPLSTQHKKK